MGRRGRRLLMRWVSPIPPGVPRRSMWSSVFRAALGHRDELEKSLASPPGRPETVAGNIQMQHLEGGPWQFLIIAPYNSRQEFAAGEKASVADALKPDG